MELLTASIIQSRHGFPTRLGGVSQAPFDSLNTSFVVGDDERAVKANLQALAREAGGPIVTARQVHGDHVLCASDVTIQSEADAVWTLSAGVSVGVRTADCLPLLIEDRRTGAVAAVHAGWRGVVSEIAARALDVLSAQGTNVADVRVAIGPCIQACCFEVDGDLPERFDKQFGAEVLRLDGPKPRLDLPGAALRTLVRSGIPRDHVVALPQCTMCDARFFSHRRDKGVTGRQLSFITGGASRL